jgi:hypothetical protein
MWGETIGETARTKGNAPAVRLGFAEAPPAPDDHGCRMY